MSAELVPVEVPGASARLQAVHVDGHAFVALRPLCDSLGIDADAQAKRLKRTSWATTSIMTVVAADGKPRQMLMIDRRTMTMWLATIESGRVTAQSRPTIEAFQREAADALDAYFNKRAVAAPAINQFDVLRAAIDQIEAAQRDAAEAKALAQLNEARLDSIEGNHGWLTALGYARNNGLPTYEKFLAKFSRCAGMIARSHDIEPNKVHHPHFGKVNSYPTWVWDLAAEGFGA
jgi:hypothetical protein